MNIIERLVACQEAAHEHYGTPAGSGVVLAARFGLPRATVAAMNEVAMWAAVVADRDRKRRIKLGLDGEATPEATSLEPSRRMIAEGLRFARCAPEDMPKGCASMRSAAWEAGWTTRCTRWVGLIPKRAKKGDPWEWNRERRVALWLEGPSGQRAVAHWTNGGWAEGWMWSPGEFRTATGNRVMLAAIKASADL